MNRNSVIIKSNAYGLILILDPDIPFEELLQDVGQKFKDAAKFFKNAKMALTFRGTLSSPTYFQASKVALLLQQKKVLEEIAALGKDCVIVGRNADVILKDYAPFNIFVCASAEAKVQRCQERAPEGENLTEKELLRKMKKIDEVRTQTRAIMSDAAWGQRSAYHITINTTGWDIKALVPAVADFAGRWFERKK